MRPYLASNLPTIGLERETTPQCGFLAQFLTLFLSSFHRQFLKSLTPAQVLFGEFSLIAFCQLVVGVRANVP